MTTASIDARSLPKPLRRGLRRVDRKIRSLALVRGLGMLAIVLAAVAAIGMALDFAWPLPLAVRWLMWIGWIASAGLVLLIGVVRPSFRRADYADLAAVAEQSRPEMGERLTSAVELLGSKGSAHGSPALIAALADDAARRAAAEPLAGAVSGRRAARTLLGGVVVVVVVVAPSFVRPDPFATLARRFFMPWADLERPSRFLIEVAPGDAVVAIGSDVPVSATVTPRFGSVSAEEKAHLEWAGSDGAWRRAVMAAAEKDSDRAGVRSFRLTLPKVAESVRYRVVTSSAEGKRHALTAVEPPSVAKVTARVEPPSYTKLPAFTARTPARIEAWEGSKVAITISANKPLTGAKIVWPVGAESAEPSDGDGTRRASIDDVSLTTAQAAWLAVSESGKSRDVAKPLPMTTPDGGKTWVAIVAAEVSGNYSFALEDEHHLANAPEPPRRVVVKPDAAPTITLAGSDDPRDAQADDLLVVELTARDDLAVVTCDLLYAIERGANSGAGQSERDDVPARCEGIGGRVARGEASLNLKSLGLRTGDVLTYQVRVTDSRPAPRGPNVTLSSIRAVRVVEKADPLLARERSIERQSLQDQLNALKKAAAENRQGAEALRYAADAAGRGNGKWNDERQADLTRREDAARAVVDGLQSLARDFADSDQFAPLERPTRQIAEVEAEGGRETLDSARQAKDDAKRLTELRAADDRLAAVQTRLDELQAKFDALVRLDDDRRKLREMAERQEELAKRAEELAKSGDLGELEKVQQEQERLRWELDEMARRSPELKAEALAARAKEADELAKKARELAARQREESRKTADPTGRAAKLKELAEAQRKLEDDARRLAMKVDRPLEENWRGRVDVGALARAAEPLDRGEIEASRQKLDEAEGALQRLARDLDDVRDDPKALARRLVRRQDVLNNQVAETINQARDPDEKKALLPKLAALAERQRAIAELAAQLPVPPEQKQALDETVRAAERPVRELRDRNTEQIPQSQNEARDRLNRLADALPDINQMRQKAMQAMYEAKNRTDQVSRELDEHLRATAPRPDQKDFDPEAAARDLARRVAPLADRQAEAVRHLAEMTPERGVQAQHEHALERARDLADALDALREAAPPESKPAEANSLSGWKLLGPFDDARKPPPFAIDRPIDLKAAFDGRKKSHPTWTPADPGGDGRFDLGARFSKEDNQSAFAYIEVNSPAKGRGRLAVGSDDTLTIWINGKRVYDFNNGRSWGPEQDRVDAVFEQGPNRLLVRCGNLNSEWAFSVKVQTPRTGELASRAEAFRKLREALPAKKADATAALERLEQKMYGRETADERAKALAAEMQAPEPDAMRSAAAALTALRTPDAVAQRAEALRRAESAAKAEAEHRPDAAERKKEAVEAVEALARRLADADSPAQRADSLADAQKGLNEAGAPRDAREQAEIQKAIANDTAALESSSPKADAARDATGQAAEMATRQVERPDSAPNAEQMAAARKHAAEALAAVAQGIEAAKPAEVAKAPTPREEAKALANTQREIAKRAEALRDRSRATPKNDAPAQAKLAADLAALARDQKAASESARAISDPHPAGSQPRREAEADRDQARAAEAKAQGAMVANDPGRAAESAKKAAEALDHLAGRLPAAHEPAPAMPRDPELTLNGEHAKEARALARRERDIREKVQSMLSDRVDAQEDLRDETAKLGRELANLRDATRDVSQKSQNPANQAADLLQHHAPPIMNEGARHLAEGRPDPARENQRRAAEVLERAAQQAEDVASALRSEAPAEAMARAEADTQGEPADGEGKPSPADLASARDAQREASRDLAQARESSGQSGERSAQAASEAMHQAAKGLRAAAAPQRSKSSSKGRTRPSEMAKTDPEDNEAGRDDAHLAELKEAIKAKTGRNWGELPGHLRSEILQMSGGKYRDDYARLIGLYFKEIAAGRDAEEKR